MAIAPGKPPEEIQFVQGRHSTIQPVEVAHQALQAGVRRMLQQPPGQFAAGHPFPALAQFAAHELELLARRGHLVGQQQAQVGEALPVVARHLADQRALAVHHLVVRQRQHEVLAVGVELAEGQLAVVEAPVHRIVRQ
jgi:hypothetical protein